MARPTLFIDGEAGTTGLQISQRLAGRADLEVVSIAPERRKDPDERRRLLNEVDLAVLCLPDAAAREAVSLIANPTVRVLDASTAHRAAPGWAYGFPELDATQDGVIAAAKRVANPGCYAVGAIALLRPLVDAGLLPHSHAVAIHAIEGYSGGGRQMVDEFEGRGTAPTADPFRLYALSLEHKHVPEIQHYARLERRPLFWPGVGAWRQGMLVQIPLFLDALPGHPSLSDLCGALARHYDGRRFVTVASAPEPVLVPDALNGTNRMELSVHGSDAGRQALLVARADNLGKGASGSALQNIDLMLGLSDARDYVLDTAA